MNFYTKKRKRPTVPIITLIDILAILLIFFIVTTTFKKRESLLKVNLPHSSELSPSDERDERISLSLNPQGQISLAGQLLPLEQLPAALGEWKRTHADSKLELKVDADTPLKTLVGVWDAATQAGVEIKDLPLKISLDNDKAGGGFFQGPQ